MLIRYSDLFALAEDFDQKPVKKGKTKGKTKVSKPVEDSNSDTDASEVRPVFGCFLRTNRL